MYRAAIATNKLQQRLQHSVRETLSPGTGTRHTALGTLLEVYDQETLALTAPDKHLAAELEQNPGLLFAKVQLASSEVMILPFKESEDQVYLTYGNAKQLAGRAVKVEYEGMSIENGQIVVQRSFAGKPINLARDCHVLDIGNII